MPRANKRLVATFGALRRKKRRRGFVSGGRSFGVESCLGRGRDRLLYVSQVVTSDTTMAMKNTTPLVSTLNPNAPLFVPAAFRAVEDFSPEWWNLVQTSPAFRDQWLREKFPGSEEQDIFAEDLEELADLDEFLEYQEQLQEMEAVQESLYFDVDDGQLCIPSLLHSQCSLLPLLVQGSV